MTGISDSFHRPINYLRVSVTDRCNLRCLYCMPPEGIHTMEHANILRYEEIIRVAEAAADIGINKVRLTGGEPLVRANIVELVKLISEIPLIDDISLTTNGILLKQYAGQLKSAGLNRINVSLDSLSSARFKHITRTGSLSDVVEGIEIARSVDLNPVKINMVVIRGINDSEIVDFARKTIKDEWHVRYIEFMPIGNNHIQAKDQFVSIQEINEKIETLGKLYPYKLDGNGPAKYYRLNNAKGTIGFISPISQHFCYQCNRLRLTADGKLRPCLLSDEEIDLRTPLRSGASNNDIRNLILKAIDSKPECHGLKTGNTSENRNMCQIGG